MRSYSLYCNNSINFTIQPIRIHWQWILQTTKDFHESEGDYTRTLRFNTTDEATDLFIKKYVLR